MLGYVRDISITWFTLITTKLWGVGREEAEVQEAEQLAQSHTAGRWLNGIQTQADWFQSPHAHAPTSGSSGCLGVEKEDLTVCFVCWVVVLRHVLRELLEWNGERRGGKVGQHVQRFGGVREHCPDNHEPGWRLGNAWRRRSGQPVCRRFCMQGWGVWTLACPEIPTLAMHLYQSPMATVMLHNRNAQNSVILQYQALFLILICGVSWDISVILCWAPLAWLCIFGFKSAFYLSVFWNQQASQSISYGSSRHQEHNPNYPVHSKSAPVTAHWPNKSHGPGQLSLGAGKCLCSWRAGRASEYLLGNNLIWSSIIVTWGAYKNTSIWGPTPRDWVTESEVGPRDLYF